MRIEPVEVDIDGLLAWCRAEGRPADATARSTYAAHLLQQRHLGPDREQPGLRAKPSRGGKGPRAKGLSAKAQAVARVAETLYRDEQLPVEVITERLGISKSTLYRYLRYRDVAIGK
ncbi:MAG: helix-turn-helix domain-containing protein [Candidatus Tectomicrobia bacterium]|nr:helix-turn-helix domain-containing protein [Candidatus Tectomicrobia bacterium]